MRRPFMLLFFPMIAALLVSSACLEDDRTQIGVVVKPLCVRLQLGQSQSFCAKVSNASDSGATWKILEGANAGTLSSSATVSTETITYTAPVFLPASCVVTVQANSIVDPTRQGQASILLGDNCPIFEDAECLVGPVPINCSSL